jgi:type I restriction-modification system DNA methylase subunit
MKELKTVVDNLIDFFDIEDVGYLGDKLKDILFSEDKEQIFDKYIEIVEDLDIDWLQKIYQYYKSNREDFKQDYTPQSLSSCLAQLLYFKGANTVYDACSGSGSLVVELHRLDNDLKFHCQELDDNVIPFLLFNLSIRNIEAVVIRGDILAGVQYEVYELKKGSKYSSISRTTDNFVLGEYDIVTSNPPFNLKGLEFKNTDGFVLPVKKSSNAFFVLHCLKHCKHKAGIILPTGFITSQQKEDLGLRQYLINENLLNSSISCPGRFFESTPVNTTILYIDRDKTIDDFVLLDTDTICTPWVRKQRGQFGGAAHTNRVYEKTFNKYSDEDIQTILDIVVNRKEVKEKSMVVHKEDLGEKHWSFSAGQYFPFEIPTITAEDYNKGLSECIGMVEEMNKDFIKNTVQFLDGYLSDISYMGEDGFVAFVGKQNEELVKLRNDLIDMLFSEVII